MNTRDLHTFTLSLGTNMADGTLRLTECTRFLENILTDLRRSEIYSTPDVSHPESAPYTNMVVRGDSALDADRLNALLKDYEKQCGRRHDSREVAIDLDIVMCDDTVLRPRDFAQTYFSIGYNQVIQKI